MAFNRAFSSIEESARDTFSLMPSVLQACALDTLARAYLLLCTGHIPAFKSINIPVCSRQVGGVIKSSPRATGAAP